VIAKGLYTPLYHLGMMEFLGPSRGEAGAMSRKDGVDTASDQSIVHFASWRIEADWRILRRGLCAVVRIVVCRTLTSVVRCLIGSLDAKTAFASYKASVVAQRPAQSGKPTTDISEHGQATGPARIF
jgi:hypothetical protein